MLLLIYSLLALSPENKPKPAPREIAGIRIVTEINDNFYPDYWKSDKEINPEASPADPKEIERVIPLIEAFVKDYPAQVLQKNLKAIHVCKVLKFYGKAYGGTNSATVVYLCLDTPSKGYTNTYLLSSMHHEFSSILLRNHAKKFPKDEWLKLNPEGFTYANNAVKSLGQENLLTPTKAARDDGFICKYSRCSMEEDFNTIADYLFNERKRLLTWTAAHPKLKAKVQLAMKFYRAIDPGFAFGELEELLK